MTPSFWSITWQVIRKDLQVEVRSRELMSMMLLFAVLSVLIFSFALELDLDMRQDVIGGILWVIVVFTSIIGLSRSMLAERENGSLDALLLAPIARSAIFMGKFIANVLFTGVIALAMLPLMTFLYNVTVMSLPMLAILLAGVIGFCATGTLLAAMTAQTRAREAMLPVALLPIALPLLLSAVRATSALIAERDPLEWQGWLGILVVMDLAYLGLSAVTFKYVVEE
jgi:heme exporter protein B